MLAAAGVLVCCLGLLIGAGMGLYGLLKPKWAATLVRLRDDPEHLGGFAEFRATYGGLFVTSHLCPFVFLGLQAANGHAIRPDVTGVITFAAAALVSASMWLGSAIGRTASMAFDRQATRYNQASTAFELALAVAIGAFPVSVFAALF